MKRINIYCFCLFFIFLMAACGKRTVPVPLEIPEAALPVINVQHPVIKGNWLQIDWQIDNPSDDSTADSFFINVFEQTESCRYCNKKPIASLELAVNDSGSGAPYYFQLKGNQYSVLLNRSLQTEWEKRGLYYLTISYRTKSELTSEESKRISPVLTDPIVEPKVTFIQQTPNKRTETLDLIFRWEQRVEGIYRILNGKDSGREVTRFYGINIYHTDKTGNSLFAEKLNKLPLHSGYARITVKKSKLYACHVDRFGNESEKVLLADYSAENQKIMDTND